MPAFGRNNCKYSILRLNKNSPKNDKKRHHKRNRKKRRKERKKNVESGNNLRRYVKTLVPVNVEEKEKHICIYYSFQML